MSDIALSPLAGIIPAFLQARQLQDAQAQRQAEAQQAEADRQRQAGQDAANEAYRNQQLELQRQGLALDREKFGAVQKQQGWQNQFDTDQAAQKERMARDTVRARQQALLERDRDRAFMQWVLNGGDPAVFPHAWEAAHGVRDLMGGQATAGTPAAPPGPITLNVPPLIPQGPGLALGSPLDHPLFSRLASALEAIRNFTPTGQEGAYGPGTPQTALTEGGAQPYVLPMVQAKLNNLQAGTKPGTKQKEAAANLKPMRKTRQLQYEPSSQGAGATLENATSMRAHVQRAAQSLNLGPAFVDLADRIARQESDYQHFDQSGKVVTSKKGAIGVMQLMPATARGLGVTNPYDPDQNVSGGVRYLAQLWRQFGGDPVKVASAYNSGKPDGYKSIPETRGYVNAVAPATRDASGAISLRPGSSKGQRSATIGRTRTITVNGKAVTITERP